MRKYGVIFAFFSLTLLALVFEQGNCQTQNENSQPKNVGSKQKSGKDWASDWKDWAGIFNVAASGDRPEWFQIADRYMTNLMANNTSGTDKGTKNKGGFLSNLFGRLSKQEKKNKNKSKVVTIN
ncbi:uncharacterized protein LOC132752808 [Ruditapes philippinarum]|uniref:uncharacterized protein LOC132752808 n=1 Tax=Ruditapes philippinarum TaxID=129788 RepID=UPI00295C0694|nr:uncharacterized protein LOC132752808 [Ruditapes philippinarum]